MYWDVFKPLSGVSNPVEPGEYLGSVYIENEIKNGINPHIAKLDLHLRQKGYKAYSENYGLIKNRKQYTF